MALDVVVLSPPDTMQGPSVPVSKLKDRPVKQQLTDTRVQVNPITKYSIVFNLHDSANPVVWNTLEGSSDPEADVDAALEAVLTVVAEATTVA